MGSMGNENNIEPTPTQNPGSGTGKGEGGSEALGSAREQNQDVDAAKAAQPAPDTAPLPDEKTRGRGLTPGQRLAEKRNKKAAQKQDFKAELKRKDDEQREQEQEEAERVLGFRGDASVPDPTAETAANVTHYVQDHSGRLVAGVLAVVALGLLVVFGRDFLMAGSAEQAKLLETALEIQSAQVDANDDDGKNDLGKPVYKSEKDRTSKAIEAFAAASKNDPSSRAGSLAKLAQGSLLTSLGKGAEAAPLFAAAFGAEKERPGVAALALEGEGIALEAAGKADDAEKRFEQLKSFDNSSHKDVAEYHLARLKLAKGDREAAKLLLKSVYDRLGSPAEGAPKSRYLKGEVEVRLAEIDSSLVPVGSGEAQQFSQEEIQRLIQQLQQQQGHAPQGSE
jgi:tetratricopeptide (TPR) repeat protein